MKKLRLEIIECPGRETFKAMVEVFCSGKELFEVKFQRNLYYAGIGSSAGRTPGVTTPCPPKEELSESYVAFVAWWEE